MLTHFTYVCNYIVLGGFVKNVKIITIESDFGAGKKGAKMGPQSLLKELPVDLLKNIPIQVINTSDHPLNNDANFSLNIDAVLHTQNTAITALEKIFTEGSIPWVISGDHSNGLAAISAYKNCYPQNRLGVIWIDAHADLHSPYTSPSGNMHGMPLAAALGLTDQLHARNKVDKETISKWNEMIELGSKRIHPKLLPSDLVFIDLRDLEEEEIKGLLDLNIKHYTPANRKEIGIKNIIEESISHLSHCHHILVSFDVDSLDPSISSGTGTPVPDGLSANEVIELLSAFLQLPKLIAFEITEINPILDRHKPMEIEAAKIIEACFKKSSFIG